MRSIFVAGLTVALWTGTWGTPRAAEPVTPPEVAAVLEKMAAAVTPGKNLEMDLAVTTSLPGQSMESKGHCKCAADGKRFAMDLTAKVAGVELPMRVVCDGTTMWSEVTALGQKMVQKWPLATVQKAGGAGNENPVQGLAELRDRFTFVEMKDGKLGTADVTILDGVVRPDFVERQVKTAEEVGGKTAAALVRPQLEAAAKARVYVDKKDSTVRKTELLDKKDQVVMATEISNFKQGMTLEDALFSYAPPKDAQVMDMEQMFKASREATKTDISAPPAPEAKTPEPKVEKAEPKADAPKKDAPAPKAEAPK